MSINTLLLKSPEILLCSEIPVNPTDVRKASLSIVATNDVIEVIGDTVKVGAYVNGVLETGIIVNKATQTLELKGLGGVTINGTAGGGGGGGGVVDQTIINGSVNAVSGNATFDALTIKADLVSGKVPAAQLPSYVDDVLEFATVAALPAIGETGKVYVITTGTDIDKQFRWSGSAYRILSFETNSAGFDPNVTSYALRFDNTKSHNVYAGRLWRRGVVYGEFYIDALVKPAQGGQYVFSAGYGAWHNILLGFNGGDANYMGVTGNVASEQPGVIPFLSVDSGVDKVPTDTWAHISLGYYNGFVTVYINGIPCKKFAKTDGRKSNEEYEVDAYIGGSNHSNYKGLIKWIRIFENQNPIHRNYSSNEVIRAELYPRSFYIANTGNISAVEDGFNANFLLDFSTPKDVITDESIGLDGIRHSASRNREASVARLAEARTNLDYLPQWEAVTVTRPPNTLVPKTVPASALIFDSFSRQDKNYLWDTALGLGNTEGGSLGVLAWVGAENFGIFNGRAYSASGGGAFPLVNAGTAFQKVSLTNCGNDAVSTSLFAAYDTVSSTGIFGYHDVGGAFFVYRQTNGANAGLGNFAAGNTEIYTVTIEYTPAHHIKVYKNNILSFDVDDSVNTTLTGTKAGFATTNAFNRITDFTVLPSQ